MKLDKVDYHLLTALDRNARMSIKHLAKEANVSRDVAAYRIKRLEEERIIDGYYAIIDYARFGMFLYRYYFRLQNTTPAIEQEIVAYLTSLPNGMTVYETDGEWQIALGLLVESQEEYHEIITAFKNKYRQYIERENVSVMNRFFHYQKNYLATEPNDRTILTGINRANLTPDNDFLLLLSVNARMSLVEMAQKLKRSPNTVKYQLKRLEQEGIIKAYRAKINHEALDYSYYKVDLTLNDTTIIPQLREYCHQHPNILFEDETIGGSDFEFDLEVENYDRFIAIINELKTIHPGKIRNWTYYQAKRIHHWRYWLTAT
jgi:Lrp/AsnC family leucine-responsive transcriptional regulator